MMSAGSSTRPGGYAAHARETLEQFAIEDTRPPEAVVQAIRSTGYDPVWKDLRLGLRRRGKRMTRAAAANLGSAA